MQDGVNYVEINRNCLAFTMPPYLNTASMYAKINIYKRAALGHPGRVPPLASSSTWSTLPRQRAAGAASPPLRYIGSRRYSRLALERQIRVVEMADGSLRPRSRFTRGAFTPDATPAPQARGQRSCGPIVPDFNPAARRAVWLQVIIRIASRFNAER